MTSHTAATVLDRGPAETYQATFVPAIAAPVSERLMDVADLRSGERVLDVACGTGLIARLAAERVGPTGSVIGVDIAPEMLEVARSVPIRGGAEVSFRVADAASLPWPDGSFDVALCQMGVMFVDDPAAAIDEMRRVIRPGGRIVINTPGAIQPPLAILDEELARQVDPNLSGFVRTVFSMHDPDAVGQLLRDAGLDGVEVSVGTVTLRLPPPQRFLWEYIGSTPLAFFVSGAPESALTALERSVLERWAPYVEEAGLLVEQPIVTASAVRSSP